MWRNCNILLITEDVVSEFLRGVECLTSNKPFDFGDDPDHNPDQGIIKRYVTIARGGQVY